MHTRSLVITYQADAIQVEESRYINAIKEKVIAATKLTTMRRHARYIAALVASRAR